MDTTVAVGGDVAVRLGEHDLPRLTDLCLTCSAFYELIEGQPATEATAAEILGPLAPKYAHGTKHVWGLERDGKLVAVAELLQGHPSIREWYLGLLLVAPALRGRSLGTQFCSNILQWMAINDATTVRAVVHHQNVIARRFWYRQGFSKEREVMMDSGHLGGPAWIFARSLGGPG